MGNRFGNFASEQAAINDIIASGFVMSGETGLYRKASMTVGNLIEPPRDCVALVQIVRCKVNPEYGADYWQQEFI